jgi:hypothetical protein
VKERKKGRKEGNLGGGAVFYHGFNIWRKEK